MDQEVNPKRLEPGRIYYNLRLAPYTSWGIGGPAAQAYMPQSIADLQAYLQSLPPGYPICWLGLGSNVLISDEGFDGAIIFSSALADLHLQADGSVFAAAGVTCARLSRFCIQHQQVGFFFAGIPGSVGGSLAMNAGAYGGETWTHVRAVDFLGADGTLQQRAKSDFDIAYRHVGMPQPGWFLGAVFDFPKDPRSPQALHQEVRSLLKKRQAAQPIGLRSCGSVFRNPPGDYAARLIEATGLKGLRRGDAQVSEKHANFIINAKDATAQDTYDIIFEVQARVLAAHQILLVPEVHFVGRFT